MLVNICMKFCEDILNGFKTTERTRFCLRTATYQNSKEHNSKKYKQKSYGILCSARRLMLVNICMKFHEDI